MKDGAIIEMYKKGMKARDIAQHFNIHPSTVWRHLKKNNIPLRGTGNYKRRASEKERLRKMIKKIGYVPPKGTSFFPETEFKKGNIPWNKGIPCSEGTKQKIRNNHIRKGIRPKNPYYAKGKDHPQWEGGKTPLIMKIRNSKQYAKWRMEVFRRDNFSCFVCGDNRGGNLNAHHIEQLSVIIDKHDIKIFEEALNCKKVWDVYNGITLCEDCHPNADEISRISSILKETA